MYSKGTAYLLWCAGFLLVCGLHRFYLGKPITGVIWLLTGGVFLIGQIVDAFLIPGMVERKNLEARLYAVETHHRAVDE